MIFDIKFYSTRSGKSVHITHNKEIYLFGYFDGFQRHAIENQIRLSSIKKIYMFKVSEIVPLIGFLLSLSENHKINQMKISKKKQSEHGSVQMEEKFYLNLDGPEEIFEILENTKSFAGTNVDLMFFEKDKKVIKIESLSYDHYYSESGHISCRRKEIDKIDLKCEKITNYIFIPDPIPGKLNIDILEKEHPDLPMKYRKDIKEKKTVHFNGSVINGSKYVESEEIIGNFLIVKNLGFLSDKGIESNCTGFLSGNEQEIAIKIIICMDREISDILILLQKVAKETKDQISKEIKDQETSKYIRKDIDDYKIPKEYLISKNFVKLISTSWFHNASLIEFTENQDIDLLASYKLSCELNKIYENYLVPTRHVIKRRNSICLTNGHCLVFRSEREEKKMLKIQKDPVESDFMAVKKSVLMRNQLDSVYQQVILPNLLFLGTGAAIPCKYRNVSSVLYSQSDFSFLFDCGEDTLGQIGRVFGNIEIIKKIKYIFISHSHADHHLGLIGLLKERYKLFKNDTDANVIFSKSVDKNNTRKSLDKDDDSILIICPNSIKRFLDLFNLNLKFILTDETTEIVHFKLNENLKISLCSVQHKTDSRAIRIDAEKSVSYSGDCRPSKEFANISENADVMIHESTFLTNISRAISTNHSLMNEAVKIWQESKAKVLILTHFSQRVKSKIERREFQSNDRISEEEKSFYKIDSINGIEHENYQSEIEMEDNIEEFEMEQACNRKNVYIAFDFFSYKFDMKWKKVEDLEMEECG